MPKINVYLPAALAERVRATNLPVSTICQRALMECLDNPATVPVLRFLPVTPARPSAQLA